MNIECSENRGQEYHRFDQHHNFIVIVHQLFQMPRPLLNEVKKPEKIHTSICRRQTDATDCEKYLISTKWWKRRYFSAITLQCFDFAQLTACPTRKRRSLHSGLAQFFGWSHDSLALKWPRFVSPSPHPSAYHWNRYQNSCDIWFFNNRSEDRFEMDQIVIESFISAFCHFVHSWLHKRVHPIADVIRFSMVYTQKDTNHNMVGGVVSIVVRDNDARDKPFALLIARPPLYLRFQISLLENIRKCVYFA